MNEELAFSLKNMSSIQISLENLTEKYLEAIHRIEEAMKALEEHMNTNEIGIYQTYIENYKEKKKRLEQVGEFLKKICLEIKTKQMEYAEKTAYLNNNIE